MTPEEWASRLDKALLKISKDAETTILNNAANSLKDDMQARIRKGFGVSEEGGGKSRFKPLSAGYKKQRASMKLSSTTSKGKSNVTQTGDMIESMSVKDGQLSITGRDNIDKAGWVQKDRPFMHASKQETKRVIENIREQIFKLLDKLL
jgi:hypothetical protein